MSAAAPLLVELGCEELPAGSVAPLAEALAAGLHKLLADNGFEPGAHQVFATPRRLAVLFDSVIERQSDRAVEKRGPAVQAAFDADGEPTRAAQGFAQSCGVSVDQLERLETDKGSWLAYCSTEAGRELEDVFGDYLAQTIDALPCPKRMRWGDSDVAFLRPVLWLTALHGERALQAEVLGLQAGRSTCGHRFHAPDAVELASAADYADVLRAHKVEPDFAARCDSIRQQVLAEAEAAGAQALLDEDLIEECAALVEWPVAIRGAFDERFLAVPKEVLIQTMQEDQRYFPLLREDGSLFPGFVTIAALESRDPDKVRAGNERVVRPRLADAEFFWEQDRKIPLAGHLPALKSVVFQEKLGTLHDRTERLVRLSRHIAARLDADQVLCERAARLAKCDLMTQTVYEFPEMQGMAGKYLVHAEGESTAVAEALEQQYWPRQAGDQTPGAIVAQVLACAEKLDTLAGIFGIGMRPTGTKDPFALRRASLGLLRILIERGLDLDLADLLAEARQILSDRLDDPDQVDQALPYILERLHAWYSDQGIERSVVDAVLALGPSRPLDIDRRIKAVTAFAELPEAEALAAANKRIQNILKKAEGTPGEVEPARFLDAAESALFEVLSSTESRVAALREAGDYSAALRELAALREPVDNFFDQVMVNADDPAVRANRLALLGRLAALCGGVADLSKLG